MNTILKRQLLFEFRDVVSRDMLVWNGIKIAVKLEQNGIPTPVQLLSADDCTEVELQQMHQATVIVVL